MDDTEPLLHTQQYADHQNRLIGLLQSDLDAANAACGQLREVMGVQATEIAELSDSCSGLERALHARNLTYQKLLARVREEIIDGDWDRDDAFVTTMLDYGMKPFERPVTVRLEARLVVEVILDHVPTELTDERVCAEIGRIIDIDPDWQLCQSRLEARVRMSDTLVEAGCTVEEFRTDSIDITSARAES